jgi:hypothetical protein
MLSSPSLPPLVSVMSPERLIDASDLALQDEELALLDLASQAWKRAEAEMQQARWLTARADAIRYLIDGRDRLIYACKGVADGKQRVLAFAERNAA